MAKKNSNQLATKVLKGIGTGVGKGVFAIGKCAFEIGIALLRPNQWDEAVREAREKDKK